MKKLKVLWKILMVVGTLLVLFFVFLYNRHPDNFDPPSMSLTKVTVKVLLCSGDMKCIGDSLSEGPDLPATTIPFPAKAELTSVPLEVVTAMKEPFATYKAPLPRGPESILLVQMPYVDEFTAKVERGEPVRIAILRGVYFLYVPDKPELGWKSKVYIGLQESLEQVSKDAASHHP